MAIPKAKVFWSKRYANTMPKKVWILLPMIFLLPTAAAKLWFLLSWPYVIQETKSWYSSRFMLTILLLPESLALKSTLYRQMWLTVTICLTLLLSKRRSRPEQKLFYWLIPVIRPVLFIHRKKWIWFQQSSANMTWLWSLTRYTVNLFMTALTAALAQCPSLPTTWSSLIRFLNATVPAAPVLAA